MGGYIATAKRVEWMTPEPVLEALHLLWDGGPDLDPCSHPDSIVRARQRVMLPEFDGCASEGVTFGDGLEEDWFGRVFVNPPFSDLAAWLSKAVAEHELHGAEVVVLMPARTDTAYWHGLVGSAAAVCFWRGRLTFLGAPASCPFPVAAIYFGHQPWLFQRAFSARGMVVRP